jgi:hypothetical protein
MVQIHSPRPLPNSCPSIVYATFTASSVTAFYRPMWTNSKSRPTGSAHSCRNATSSRRLEKQVADSLGGLAHPIPFQVLWNAVSSEPSEPEMSERVEPHRLTRVDDTEYISLLQRAPLFGREEVPADAGNISRSSMAKTSGISATRTAFGVFGSCSCPHQILRHTWTTFSGLEPARPASEVTTSRFVDSPHVST